ncbi:DUF2515 family protein [Bacillus sp. AK128]
MKTFTFSKEEREIVHQVKNVVDLLNTDNISRTNAYGHFYERNPEVKWAFLASMVSRNAGWNMCDLKGKWFPKVLSSELRQRLFLTYERANWLIFSDAYPQLYLYELSKDLKKDLSYLLPCFYISPFMQKAWEQFMKYGHQQNLLRSLIINEQNLIQRPVIEHPVYKNQVFKTWLFLLQDWLHFSVVLFPSRKGNLYGSSVHDFRKIDSRIKLGKRLAAILFHPSYYDQIFEFSKSVPHTGSRHDYEQFVYQGKDNDTPLLRSVFPVIEHHRQDFKGWYASEKKLLKWMEPYDEPLKKIEINDWYKHKQEQLHSGIYVDSLIMNFLTK